MLLLAVVTLAYACFNTAEHIINLTERVSEPTTHPEPGMQGQIKMRWICRKKMQKHHSNGVPTAVADSI